MEKISARQLREKFFAFFKKKKHAVIPAASLIPQGDSSTLFISAGMHPLVPYLMGEVHPLGKRLVDVQECLRTVDIEAVGDAFHHTWFEMLGNWSLGDYFKKEAIAWSFEFLTQVLRLNPERLHVTCFAGDQDAPQDKESASIWRKLGLAEDRIHFLPKKDNWWGPVGETGPCGPDTEMFVDTLPDLPPEDFQQGCQRGRYVEVWNNVFMEYYRNEKGEYEALKQKNVDTGMGVERVLAVLWGKKDNYLTSVWQPIIEKIEELTGKSYQNQRFQRPMRIIADHLRAAVFVIAEGVLPGNKEQGYVLRRLIRRSVRQGNLLGAGQSFVEKVGKAILDNQEHYAGEYPKLRHQQKTILSVLAEEEGKFNRTLSRGLRELNRLLEELKSKRQKKLSGQQAFYLYETFGFPLELTVEEAQSKGLAVDEKGFWASQEKHQQKSRQSAAGRFKGGLAEHSPQAIAYHTATHLLHQALREVLGNHVAQEGSAITPERMRFDFSHPSPLTSQQIKKVEELVNQKIKENLPVKMEVMEFSAARQKGALFLAKVQYPPRVKVYSIGDFSCEVCGGPHVERTAQLGHFKIIKEESCGSGKRRIYAILED